MQKVDLFFSQLNVLTFIDINQPIKTVWTVTLLFKVNKKWIC